MKIEVVTKNVDNETALREFIHRKVHFALDRHDARVGRVVVRLEDETPGRAVFDGLCQIDLSVLPHGDLHVSARSDSPEDCILQATRKMEHALKHDLDRHRQSARARHMQARQPENPAEPIEPIASESDGK